MDRIRTEQDHYHFILISKCKTCSDWEKNVIFASTEKLSLQSEKFEIILCLLEIKWMFAFLNCNGKNIRIDPFLKPVLLQLLLRWDNLIIFNILTFLSAWQLLQSSSHSLLSVQLVSKVKIHKSIIYMYCTKNTNALWPSINNTILNKHVLIP